LRKQQTNNEKELLTRFRKGEEAAFSSVVALYQREICFFSTRILKDREAAEEIVGDCFLKVWDARSQFNSLPDVRSYLYVAARNASLNFLKSPRNRQMASIEEVEAILMSDDSVETRIVYTELLAEVYREVARLPEKQRQVFNLTYFEGLSAQEIAERLGISANAVYFHKHEATKAIRLVFADRGPLFFLLFPLIFAGG